MLKRKSPTRDGTIHIVMQPQEVMQRLAVRVPRPRLHLIRDHGVLAPNAKLRGAVIPQPARKDSAPGQEHTQGQAARMRWARLLKRVFHIHVERCACGRQLNIVAAIEEPVVIVGIRTHLGLAELGAAARSGAGVVARLRSLSGEHDNGSGEEPKDMLGL